MPVEAIANIMSDLRTTWGTEGGARRESHNREEMESKSEQTDGARRSHRSARLLNIIFSARENFSLFRSPAIVAVVFSRERARGDERRRGEERRENFPFRRFRSLYVPTACSRGARRAAPLLVLSFVNHDERSRLGGPSLRFFFFSSSPRSRRPSRCQ